MPRTPGPSRLLADLAPVDRVHAAFYALVFAVATARVGVLPQPVATLGWFGGACLATLALARRLRGRTGAPGVLPRAAFALVTGPVTFLMLGTVVPYANPWHAERFLHDVDTALFLGSNPNVLLDRIAWPPLTELLQIDYALYYFMPVVLLGSFVLRRDWAGLGLGLFLAVLCLYASYLGYFLVPATGPNLNALGLYPPHFAEPMEGLWFAEPLRAALLEAEAIKHDCWPSGHAALTLTCLVIAHRTHRPTYRVLFVPVVLLVFSTMYLRYHYVIDVISGVALAWAVLHFGPRWYDRARAPAVTA